MVQLAWLLIFVAVGGVSAATSENDHDANINEHPYVVSILLDNKHVCAGAILDKNHIITSMQCVPSFEHTFDYRGRRVVVTNAQTILDIGVRYPCKDTYSQNHFVNPTRYPFMSGAAILKLTRQIPLGDKVRAIQFHEGEVPVGAKVQMLGWGIVDSRQAGDKGESLKKVTLRVIDRESCQPFHEKQLTDDEFCTQREAECQYCKGDKGSPLIYEDKLVGMANLGISCDESRPIPDVHKNAESMSIYAVETLQ